MNGIITTIRWRKLAGKRGTWFAEVTWEDGIIEILPIALSHLTKFDKALGMMTYEDKFRPHHYAKADEFAEAVRSKGRVVLADSIPPKTETSGAEVTKLRDVFDVAHVSYDDRVLRFALPRRYRQAV